MEKLFYKKKKCDENNTFLIGRRRVEDLRAMNGTGSWNPESVYSFISTAISSFKHLRIYRFFKYIGREQQ